jgi:hypothetical protein
MLYFFVLNVVNNFCSLRYLNIGLGCNVSLVYTEKSRWSKGSSVRDHSLFVGRIPKVLEAKDFWSRWSKRYFSSYFPCQFARERSLLGPLDLIHWGSFRYIAWASDGTVATCLILTRLTCAKLQVWLRWGESVAEESFGGEINVDQKSGEK